MAFCNHLLILKFCISFYTLLLFDVNLISSNAYKSRGFQLVALKTHPHANIVSSIDKDTVNGRLSISPCVLCTAMHFGEKIGLIVIENESVTCLIEVKFEMGHQQYLEFYSITKWVGCEQVCYSVCQVMVISKTNILQKLSNWYLLA